MLRVLNLTTSMCIFIKDYGFFDSGRKSVEAIKNQIGKMQKNLFIRH